MHRHWPPAEVRVEVFDRCVVPGQLPPRPLPHHRHRRDVRPELHRCRGVLGHVLPAGGRGGYELAAIGVAAERRLQRGLINVHIGSDGSVRCYRNRLLHSV